MVIFFLIFLYSLFYARYIESAAQWYMAQQEEVQGDNNLYVEVAKYETLSQDLFSTNDQLS